MRPTISIFSTALYSTWAFVEEFGVLFDAGDGVSALLGQHTGKIHHIFVSHADRDHLSGLLQLIQLRARPTDPPRIYYPKDCGSFPALAEFSRKFDPHIEPAPQWHGIEDGARIHIGKNRFVTAIRNDHVEAPPDAAKSLSYLLVEERSRLKPEFVGRTEAEIAKLAAERVHDAFSEPYDHPLIGFSGDTPVRGFEHWRGVETLIHEATFLYRHHRDRDGKVDRHSVLEEVLTMAAEAQPERLILTHFSTRYEPGEVREFVTEQVKAAGLSFPVHLVEPGKLVENVLNS